MNVSVELKIIIHLPVSAIGYMSAVTTYFSALNIHFSGVTSGRNFRELGGYETLSGKKIRCTSCSEPVT